MVRMSNKTNAKLYFFSALAIAGFLATVAILSFGLNELIVRTFDKSMFTPDEFRDCVGTIALIMFVTTQAPLLSIAAIYWKKFKTEDKNDT